MEEYKCDTCSNTFEYKMELSECEFEDCVLKNLCNECCIFIDFIRPEIYCPDHAVEVMFQLRDIIYDRSKYKSKP